MLLAEAELGDERQITVTVLLAEIVEQRTTLVDHHQQAAAGVVVLGVPLEVLGQVLDPLRQDRDLDLGRPGVVLAAAMVLDDLLLLSLVFLRKKF